MAKVFVFQTCDKDYTNRLVDRLVTKVADGCKWIRETAYPYYNWTFQDTTGSDEEGTARKGNWVCSILRIYDPAEQGESGHISDINILLSPINLTDIPALRCMSRTNLRSTSMCIRTQCGDAKTWFLSGYYRSK